ncbi:metal ABC transporter permease [Cyanobium sp. NIES-981]|uniref:metal ABC transporter permease n=1 Tax=Cyanobium sp. NIES-981 TaxID=1851505 RepID=UPI0007DD48A8|nr:metal ABC transporter permease [Cyanobium sp. NIES-981]SBO41832.1 ABC-type Mn2+/Zn2+ transport system, permease component [Cyanobium sp. NIES-981]
MSPAGLPPLGELLQFPFMQRALLAGLLSGSLGGLLGSFTVLRQLSFFSDALGHSALLGISLGLLLGLNPTLVLIPFAVGFALLVGRLVERSRLPTDALLNVVYSSALAIAVVVLTALPGQRGRLEQLLFGDILAVGWADLALLATLLALALAYLVTTRRSQILLTLDPAMATARGVAVGWQRLLFMVVLAVVVALSIKAVGVLLISAFLVIPACAARQISSGFGSYLWLSAITGGSCGLLGILASGLFNLPSGPCVVIVQLLAFVLALLLSSRQAAAG